MAGEGLVGGALTFRVPVLGSLLQLHIEASPKVVPPALGLSRLAPSVVVISQTAIAKCPCDDETPTDGEEDTDHGEAHGTQSICGCS